MAFNATHRVLHHVHSSCLNVTSNNYLLLIPTFPGIVRLNSVPCYGMRIQHCESHSTMDISPSLNGKIQRMMIVNLRHLRYRATIPNETMRIQGAECSAPSMNSIESCNLRRTFTIPAPRDDRSANIYTVPNAICVIRIAASPFIGYLVLAGRYELALCCFVLAGISDGKSYLRFT